MGLSVKFMACNAGCKNCYENDIREEIQKGYDFKRVIARLNDFLGRGNCGQVTLHGGEPLLIDIQHIRQLFELIYDKTKQTGIQTNLLNLSQYHIELFKKYRTHVGVSLDGFDTESNKSRGYEVEKILENLQWLKSENISCSVIAVIWKSNCESMVEFLTKILDLGIKDIRLNPGIGFCDVENEVTPLQLFKVWEDAIQCCFSPEINLLPHRDIIDMLLGFSDSTCNFSGCDPHMTSAEETLYEDGQLGNCLKPGSARDGFRSMRADQKNNVRQELLQQIAIDKGGCGGCKYWQICKGGCPGEAISFDWRNRTRFCQAWYWFFESIETRLKTLFPNLLTVTDFSPEKPASKDVLETIAGSTWRRNKMAQIWELKKRLKNSDIISDGSQKCLNHGDSPHGDRHGDHTDANETHK